MGGFCQGLLSGYHSLLREGKGGGEGFVNKGCADGSGEETRLIKVIYK